MTDEVRLDVPVRWRPGEKLASVGIEVFCVDVRHRRGAVPRPAVGILHVGRGKPIRVPICEECVRGVQ